MITFAVCFFIVFFFTAASYALWKDAKLCALMLLFGTLQSAYFGLTYTGI